MNRTVAPRADDLERALRRRCRQMAAQEDTLWSLPFPGRLALSRRTNAEIRGDPFCRSALARRPRRPQVVVRPARTVRPRVARARRAARRGASRAGPDDDLDHEPRPGAGS